MQRGVLRYIVDRASLIGFSHKNRSCFHHYLLHSIKFKTQCMNWGLLLGYVDDVYGTRTARTGAISFFTLENKHF